MDQMKIAGEFDEQIYDSSLLLHAREIKRYWREFCNTSAEEMSFRELVRHLEFLEMCAISTELHYDGSIPEEYARGVEEVRNEIATVLKKETKFPPEITSLNYEESEQRLELAVKAVKAGFRQICEVFDYTKQPGVLDKLIEEKKARDLVSALQKARTANESTRENMAMELINKGPKDFWGGKFAAGIVHPRNDKYFRKFVELLESKTDESIWPRLFQGIADTFRTHLLSSWAAGKRSAYYPTGHMRIICESHTLTFWQYIQERLCQEYGKGRMKDINMGQFRESNEVQLPLIGLEVLLRAEGPHVEPKLLLAHAMNLSHERDFRLFLKYVVKAQLGVMKNEQSELPTKWKEHSDEVSALLYSYGIVRSPKDLSLLGKIYRWLAISGTSATVAKLVNDGIRHFLENKPLSGVSITAATATVATAGVVGYVLERMWQENRQREYISFMSRLLAGADNITKRLLAERVDTVWGRKLVFE